MRQIPKDDKNIKRFTDPSDVEIIKVDKRDGKHMDSVEKYRQRRDVRIKKRLDDDWITVKGTHVMIDDEGQVTKGPESLKKGKVHKTKGLGLGFPKDSNDKRRMAEENVKMRDMATTSDDDFEKEGYKKNSEGKWEKVGSGENPNIGLKVKHRDYGEGEIEKINPETGSIYVRFGEKTRIFSEDAFDKGYIKEVEGKYKPVAKKVIKPVESAKDLKSDMSENVTHDVYGGWGKKMNEMPDGTKFTIQTGDRWHEEMETFTKEKDGWEYERKINGNTVEYSSRKLSDVWNSLKDGSVVDFQKGERKKTKDDWGNPYDSCDDSESPYYLDKDEREKYSKRLSSAYKDIEDNLFKLSTRLKIPKMFLRALAEEANIKNSWDMVDFCEKRGI